MDDVLKLRDLVYQETGMFFPDEKRYYFESRFNKRVKALTLRGFNEYFLFLKSGKDRKNELNLLMNELTINETSFFRNKPQFSALEKIIIPEIVKAKEGTALKKLKLWSAGCSSGEEVYTLAMIANEMQKTILKGWNIEIVGTDISKRVLAKAESGLYREYAVKNMPELYKKKYITQKGDEYQVDPGLNKIIKFTHFNLNDDMAMMFMKGFDIIFCKNVLIYFDINSKKRVIQHFFNSLIKGGYLFVGFSESLFGINDRFKLIHYPGGMVYRKIAHI
ncbi:protein-glutamate O-methyltransferase CheR [bacterium]|nr:protein-glutamate O-methyltransferase CheR [bacterium]